jgi:hypothetical protein
MLPKRLYDFILVLFVADHDYKQALLESIPIIGPLLHFATANYRTTTIYKTMLML